VTAWYYPDQVSPEDANEVDRKAVMSLLIATVAFALGILGLFVLNRDREVRTSKALWMPLVWLLIAGSRNVGEWLQMGGPADTGDAYLEGNAIDRNLLASLVILGLIVLFSRRQRIAGLLRANWPILLYFFYCGVSILWSAYPYVGFKRWIRAVGDIVMVLVVLTDRNWLAALKRLFAWTSLLLLPLSILFIRYYPALGRGFDRDGTPHWNGVTTSKNSLGMICLVLGLATLWRLLLLYRRREGRHNMRRLVAHGALLAMVVWLLSKVHSATSFACFFMAGGVMLLTSRRAFARRRVFVHAIALATLSLSFYALFLDDGGGLVGALGRNSTLTGRTDVWNLVLSLKGSPLFGTGFESFWLGERLATMRSLDTGLNQAHNGYLEIFLNLGWVGLTLLAIVMATGYRNIIGALPRDPEVGSLRLAFLIIGAVYNFTEAAFKMMSPIWIVFLLAIVSVPRRESEGQVKSSDKSDVLPNNTGEDTLTSPIPLGVADQANHLPSNSLLWVNSEFDGRR
jgi:exopolysaccharide production protein ExoQ